MFLILVIASLHLKTTTTKQKEISLRFSVCWLSYEHYYGSRMTSALANENQL